MIILVYVLCSSNTTLIGYLCENKQRSKLGAVKFIHFIKGPSFVVVFHLLMKLIMNSLQEEHRVFFCMKLLINESKLFLDVIDGTNEKRLEVL